MTKHTQHYYLPRDVDGIEQLFELALDVRWSWNHSADELWGQIDPDVWTMTHNPWVVLQTASRNRLRALAADPSFRQQVEALLLKQRQYAEADAWFQKTYQDAALTCVAYFSMEFMLSEALPIYSGGLGNVAGDQLKAASDLGVPVVGVGLLYQQGYFRQVLDAQGAQRALYPHNDPMQLPITPVRDDDGHWVRVEVIFAGYKVRLRAWQAQVGRVKLYLLDSNDPANMPAERGLTSELYGGGPELRLAQEIALGIGGWQLLRTLGLQPEVCHLNEGHAAFAVLERARTFMEDSGQSFDEALATTRAGNLFTTHTPVAAGFDRFAPALMEQYLGRYAQAALGITLDELLALGRENPQAASEPFNMAYLAIHGSAAINGVSRLHGEVSRKMFQPFFTRWPEAEVPIGHVTNGIHVPSWDSQAADELWTKVCGPDRWSGTMETVEEDFRRVPDTELWEFRVTARHQLIRYTRERLSQQLAAAGAPTAAVEHARYIFDPNVLTLGFARRFATYKRPNLLLHDPERLVRLLTNSQYPVQLILAGKAHPQDRAGQEMIQAWTQFISRQEVRSHVVFLSDYDMLLTEHLVRGVDVWLNTPRRPWEASGTSGMKVLVNGGLNISELDGWWAEAYTPEVGWALGDGQEHEDEEAWDECEAEALYTILEHEVIPAFYTRDDTGIPTAWVARMRESMARLTPRFSANRTVREYTERYYLPRAAAYCKRAAERGSWGRQVRQWQRTLAHHWTALHLGNLQVETSDSHYTLRLPIYLGEISPDAVRVELYADACNGEGPGRYEMQRDHQLVGAMNGYLYTAQVPATRPVTDYTPRIIPHHPDATVPLEASHILWAR